MSIETVIFILYGFLFVSITLIALIAIQKTINRRNLRLRGIARDILFKKYFDQEDVKMPFSNHFFIDAYIDVETQISIDPSIRVKIIEDLFRTSFIKKQIRLVKCINVIKRRIAIFYLASMKNDITNALLKKRLAHEKNESARFEIIYALTDEIDQEVFDLIVNSLNKSRSEYRRWVYAVLNNHYEKIKRFLEPYYIDQRLEVKELLIHLASHTVDLKMKEYALRIFHESIFDEKLRMRAIYAVAKMHPDEIANPLFCEHQNNEVKKVAYFAASNIISKQTVDNLLNHMDGGELDSDRIQALSRIVFESRKLLLEVLKSFPSAKQTYQRQAIAKTLSHRIDYLMLKINDPSFSYIKEIIDLMLQMHLIEDFMDFMNHNKDESIENEIIPIIKRNIGKDMYLLNEFSIYLNQSILTKLSIMKKPQPSPPREKAARENNKIIWITSWILIAILTMPMIYVTTQFNLIFSGTINFFTFMIINFNRYLVIYFMTVNTIYTLLLFFSIKGSNERISQWQIKKNTLLFERDLLPSISIIAPAYNEEKSIIESITSLLNLKYPKYEVIVINDGSKDDTINTLINHFDLERKHPFFKQKIQTKPLRGVYVNKKIPNLIVIDKQNGGKADALNMGINVAKNDYVCGIDADSLLEEEALLKLMSITLDQTIEHIAIGGNIVPVNGSIVDKGKVEKSQLGKQGIVRFQTLEYLRAFTTGRIGWSKLKSLLIVSGAFGLFKRKSLEETGGYLTISGILKKDTVGEDMELVVRLTHQALIKNKPYRVEYVHHANCYTELPSDYRSLFKQRNRWQRGLLDILSYHRRMLFNPRYKQPGLIAFPYFFIFEMIGPFIEVIGYAALIIGLLLNILNPPLVILLFIATILYGIVVSLFSLYVAERKTVLYSNKETLILIGVAILENFGYRQIMSVHRIISTFSALKESGTWGSQTRKGFQQL